MIPSDKGGNDERKSRKEKSLTTAYRRYEKERTDAKEILRSASDQLIDAGLLVSQAESTRGKEKRKEGGRLGSTANPGRRVHIGDRFADRPNHDSREVGI